MKSYYAHYVFFLDETKPATAVLLSTCAPGDLRSYELDHNHHINLEYKVYYFDSMQKWLEQFMSLLELKLNPIIQFSDKLKHPKLNLRS